MFKKFEKGDQKALVEMKKNVAKKTRASIINFYGGEGSLMEHVMDEIWRPGKRDGADVHVMSCVDKVELLIIDDVPMFYNQRGGQYIPTLRILHQYPDLLPKQKCDRGAIKFVLSGANIMCPGLTHENAELDESIEDGTIVGIYAEGKEHAMAIGQHCMSGKAIREVNKGIGINLIHYLNDGLWHFTSTKD